LEKGRLVILLVLLLLLELRPFVSEDEGKDEENLN
jgi:hypothetical protein